MPPEPPPSNALWLTFIAAWRDDAQAKGSKAAQTYQKAYRSLSACPIPFQHPCQTTQLVGIGPMIAKRLEQDLQKWCQENGETMPERPEAPQPASKSRASKSSSTAEASGQIGEPSDLTSVQDATRKKPRATKKKAYVPQPRSGAYGLLLGLYLQTRPGPGGEEVYLSKADLIDAAQPHCDSDYLNGGARTAVTASLVTTGAGDPTASTSSRGKSTYSAWSSMKTLISKDLVYQTGNPPKFCLSEEGFELARTMAEAEGIRPKGSGLASGSTSSREEPHEEVGVKRPSKRLRLPGSTEGPEGASAPKRTSRSGPREADSVVPLQTGVGSTRSLFRYAYLTDGVDIDAVLSRSDAASRPSRRGSGLCYHIRFPRELCSHSLVVKHVEMVQEDATSSDMLTGFLHELKADLIAPGLRGSGPDVTAVATSSTAVVASETASINFEEWDQATVVQHSLLNTTTNPPRRRAPRLSQVVPPPAAGESWHSRLAPSPRSHQTASRPLDSPNRHRRVASGSSVVLADDGPMPLSSPLRRTPSETHHELGTSVNEDMDGDVGASRETRWTDTEGRPKFRPIHLPAGSYTIHLILDNRERHHAGFANQRVSLASALESKGVEVEVRPLELGDAIWIARRKDGGGAEGDEAVLDFIVERKRLDDLTSSILDGRWRDQKVSMEKRQARLGTLESWRLIHLLMAVPSLVVGAQSGPVPHRGS